LCYPNKGRVGLMSLRLAPPIARHGNLRLASPPLPERRCV